MLAQQDLEHVLFHTGSLWNNLKYKRIFITGGTGFLGKWLLESFAEANTNLHLNAQLHVLSRNPDQFKQKFPYLSDKNGIFFHQGDVRNFTFPKEKFDYIIHAATEASVQLNLEDPLVMVDTIVNGTRRVLDFARSCGAKRLLFTSSGAVYGKQPVELTHVPETYTGAPDPSHPAAAYGEAKRLAELLCSIYHRQYQIEVVTARCFTFIGPYLPLDLEYAVGNFIKDGLENKSIQIQGDGTTLRSYLHAADLTVWLWTILVLGKPGAVYNVGSDQEVSIFELATKIGSAFGNTMDIVVSQKAIPGKTPDQYVPDITLAKKELSLDCRIDIDDAIWRTIDFYKKIEGVEALFAKSRQLF